MTTDVMAGLVPAIHVFNVAAGKTWMPGIKFTLGPAIGGTRVPGMTRMDETDYEN